MYTKISNCRICQNTNLIQVIDLGEQYLTGVFPHSRDMEKVTKGPLRLVKCHGDSTCGLLQLEHSYSLDEMYGENYGYRSGLNSAMVKHLNAKVQRIVASTNFNTGDLVIDIGANDGTTLGFYPDHLDLVGVDPTGAKFQKYYKPHVKLIPDFFSEKNIAAKLPGRKAKVVTSFSMFYDLENPVAFASEVAAVLDPSDGKWIFEQSYMPLMLEMNSYDTICHEHLEYYGLKQIQWITDKAGLKIIDVEMNDVNGGSFSIVAALKSSDLASNDKNIQTILQNEEQAGLSTLKPYEDFFERVKQTRVELRQFIENAKKSGKRICGLGASTKGNVLLQYCGFTDKDIEVIADVNPDKFGAYAPGTCIPIDDEKKVLKTQPDYLLVLPWHFREFFVNSPNFKNHNLVFPLPKIETVSLK